MMKLTLVCLFALMAVPALASEQEDRELDNLNDVLSEARAVPVFENGKHKGYKKVDIQTGEDKRQLSLKEGETIMSVPNPDSVQNSADEEAQQ